jgi:hypothetical protein
MLLREILLVTHADTLPLGLAAMRISLRTPLTAGLFAVVMALSTVVPTAAYTSSALPAGAFFSGSGQVRCTTNIDRNGGRSRSVEETASGPQIFWAPGVTPPYRSAQRLVDVSYSTDGSTWNHLDTRWQTVSIGGWPQASASFPAYGTPVYNISKSIAVRVREAFYLYTTASPETKPAWYTPAWAYHDDYNSLVYDFWTGIHWLGQNSTACVLS